MNNFFVGIDGGGTKCKVRVEDASGQLLGQAVSGPANVRLSVEATWQAIHEGLESVFKTMGTSSDKHRLHVCAGVAGLELPDAKKAFLDYPHSFTHLHLTSDAHIACVGAHHGHDGAIIVVGTGVIGYQIQHNQGTRVSGWGFPHDDEGGGAWLGLEAVKLTFQWLDQRVEKSSLVEDIFAYFNQDKDYLIAWTSKASSTDYAKLAPIIINHAQQEEVAAVRLLKKAAHAIERVWHALLKIQNDKSLSCCLMGGIAPFIEPLLEEEFRQRLIVRKDEPTVGAILLMRKLMAEKGVHA